MLYLYVLFDGKEHSLVYFLTHLYSSKFILVWEYCLELLQFLPWSSGESRSSCVNCSPPYWLSCEEHNRNIVSHCISVSLILKVEKSNGYFTITPNRSGTPKNPATGQDAFLVQGQQSFKPSVISYSCHRL